MTFSLTRLVTCLQVTSSILLVEPFGFVDDGGLFGSCPPLPNRDTLAVPAGSLLAIFSSAERLPVAIGAKIKVIEQLAPVAIEPRQPYEVM